MKDVSVQMGKLLISCDFIIMDMDESYWVPITLKRPFLVYYGSCD